MFFWTHTQNDEQRYPTRLGTTCRMITLQTMFPLLPMLSVTHITPVLVLLSVVGVGMQQCIMQNQNEMHKLGKAETILNKQNNQLYSINSFRPLFPDMIFSQTLSWHFVDSCQNPRHFQVFQTSGHPGHPWLSQFDMHNGNRRSTLVNV